MIIERRNNTYVEWESLQSVAEYYSIQGDENEIKQHLKAEELLIIVFERKDEER